MDKSVHVSAINAWKRYVYKNSKVIIDWCFECEYGLNWQGLMFRLKPYRFKAMETLTYVLYSTPKKPSAYFSRFHMCPCVNRAKNDCEALSVSVIFIVNYLKIFFDNFVAPSSNKKIKS